MIVDEALLLKYASLVLWNIFTLPYIQFKLHLSQILVVSVNKTKCKFISNYTINYMVTHCGCLFFNYHRDVQVERVG